MRMEAEAEELQRHQHNQAQEPGNHRDPQRLRKDDLVQSLDDPNRLGYVVRVPNSDSESDSDSDSDYSDSEDEPLLPGNSRVSWNNTTTSRTERLENSQLRLLDRTFAHGDYVAHANDPYAQSGLITEVYLTADVTFRYANVSWTMQNVDSRDLRRVRPLMEGDYVVREHWLGRVDEVVDNLTLVFEDGSKCVVLRADPETLLVKRGSEEEDTSETTSLVDYYPGATVREKSFTSLVFRKAKWISGSWIPGKREATVVGVSTSYVMVTWLSSGSGGRTSGEPEEKQKPKDLVLLPRFADVEWDVGDYTLEVDPHQAGLIRELRKLRKFQVTKPGRRLKRITTEKLLKKVPRDGYSGKIIRTRTFADVLWQDGSRGLRIPTTELQDTGPYKFHEFWPESYVVENLEDEKTGRAGVVKAVDVKQRTATVKWFKATSPPEVLGEFESEEVVSVYELSYHPDFRYGIGDIVVRLSSPDKKPGEPEAEPGEPTTEAGETEGKAVIDEPAGATTGETDAERGEPATQEPGETEEDDGETDEEAAQKPGETEQNPGETDLSWVGTIVGCEDGDIEVKWASEDVSKIRPQSIYVVHRPDSDESSDDEDDDDDSRSWETVGSDEERRVLEESDDDDDDEPAKTSSSQDANPSSSQDAKPSSSQEGAMNFVIGLASRVISAVSEIATKGLLLKPGPNESNPSAAVENGDENLKLEEEEAQEPEEKNPEESEPDDGDEQKVEYSEEGTPGDEEEKTPGDEQKVEEKTPGDEQKAEDSEAGKPEEDTVEEFSTQDFTQNPGEAISQFDVVSDATDHHFVDKTYSDAQARDWQKVVWKEWNILQKNLPDSIFVRMYEDRLNLLRAVIVGAAGTPYEDGLFVFDFHLPDGYPSYPPIGHYHSFGLYLNPNLYADGKICLSLLNTWRGKDTEMWTPGASNILQVLLSIQGLVLNSKPYFNEADFDRYVGTDGGELAAIEYNESAFILTCKTMLNLLRRPPMHLEELIKSHFRSRATRILATCRAYYNGVPVGSSSGESSSESNTEAPAGFKLLIRKAVPMLVAAFKEIGATGCEEFLIE